MAKTIAEKMLIKPDFRILILNAPQDYINQLELPVNVEVLTDAGSDVDLVHLFVQSIADLEEQGLQAINQVKEGGLIWISYPKKSSAIETDISRDHGWSSIMDAGYRPVTQISIDDTWSALRYRPAEKVGT